MSALYASSPVAIRGDLAAAHDRASERIGQPGSWWDGAQRVRIAAETRHASSCRLCPRRKEALSPAAIEGTHDSLGELSEVVVEVVHRVRNDPGRLSERWYRGVIAGGLSEERYVETVSVVAHVVAVDTMARGLGLDARPLPRPRAGAPSQHRPAAAKPGGAWVPWLQSADLSDAEADLYPTRPARRKHHESDEPRARRGARLLRPGVSPIHAAVGDARLLARVPSDRPFADRALGGAGIGAQSVSLLNDPSHPAAPCERRDPK